MPFFNKEMTRFQARQLFFEIVEGKTDEEIEAIKAEYSEILELIMERELKLAEDGWLD